MGYIEKEKVLDYIKEYYEQIPLGSNSRQLVASFKIFIEKAPDADVVEVKHGEWVQEWELEKGLEDNDEIPYIKCSLCGHTEWYIDKERDTTPNYCSDCGAKMGGGNAE